jgi:hypothetical protein
MNENTQNSLNATKSASRLLFGAMAMVFPPSA